MLTRYYDPALGRWMSPDPLAAKYPGWTPYNYVLGNPLKYIDPHGLEPCPYDPDEECGIIMDEVVVEADRYDGFEFPGFGSAEHGIVYQQEPRESERPRSRTFRFDASTDEGQDALYSQLRATQSGCGMVANQQFSVQARSIAMRACIHDTQTVFLRRSIKIGAVTLGLATASATGVGMFASAGLFELGGTLAWGATAFSAADRMLERDVVGLGVTVATFGTAHGLNTGVNTLRASGSISAIDAMILRSTAQVSVGVTAMSYEAARQQR